MTRRKALFAGVGTLLTGGGIVYGASTLDSAEQTADAPPVHASDETTGFGLDLAGHPIMGPLDAPVDLYYWSDYQCPFCRRFERNALPKLIENQVRPGRLRVVFVEYPYLGAGSMTAAVMDRCVWRTVREDAPRAYWRWHSAVFDEQASENSDWASKANLLDVTRRVDGVDASAVESCVAENRADIEASIQADVEQASGFGVDGTPSFVLYNRSADAAGKLVGAQPYERFEGAIERVQNA
jgi:protein-disulfide isomerase